MSVEVRLGRIMVVTLCNGDYWHEIPKDIRPLLPIGDHIDAFRASKVPTGSRFVVRESSDVTWYIVPPEFDIEQADDLLAAAMQVGRKVDPILLFDYRTEKKHRPGESLVGWAATLAVEPERGEEWREVLQTIADSGTRSEIIRYLIGVLWAGAYSRAVWIAKQAARPAVTTLRWVLRSDFRTWTPLSVLLLVAGIEEAEATGVGVAILLVAAAGATLSFLVEKLRERLDAHPRRGKTSDESSLESDEEDTSDSEPSEPSK